MRAEKPGDEAGRPASVRPSEPTLFVAFLGLRGVLAAPGPGLVGQPLGGLVPFRYALVASLFLTAGSLATVLLAAARAVLAIAGLTPVAPFVLLGRSTARVVALALLAALLDLTALLELPRLPEPSGVVELAGLLGTTGALGLLVRAPGSVTTRAPRLLIAPPGTELVGNPPLAPLAALLGELPGVMPIHDALLGAAGRVGRPVDRLPARLLARRQ